MTHLILKGEFEQVCKLIQGKSIIDIYNSISKEANRTTSINFYGFFVNLLAKKEWEDDYEDIHHICSVLLSTELCSIEGAYNLAIFHIKKCIALSDNAEYIRYLKHLESVPDTL